MNMFIHNKVFNHDFAKISLRKSKKFIYSSNNNFLLHIISNNKKNHIIYLI